MGFAGFAGAQEGEREDERDGSNHHPIIKGCIASFVNRSRIGVFPDVHDEDRLEARRVAFLVEPDPVRGRYV